MTYQGPSLDSSLAGSVESGLNPGNTPCCMIHFTKNVKADLTAFLS
jgi:hypothetical protein